jgi:hypothetical protein
MRNFSSKPKPGPSRRRMAFVAVLLAAGLAGCSSHSTSTTLPQADVAATAVPKPATSYIFGHIIAQNGSNWTVKGIRGNLYAVTVTPRTDFGSLFHRQTRDQFKVGSNVRIAGVFAGTTVAANAVDFAK